MGFYWIFFRKLMAREWIYKFNSFFKMMNRLILLSVQIVVWKAVYTSGTQGINSEYGEIGLQTMIGYTIYSHLLFCLMNFTTVESMNQKIKTGEIAFNLSKPYSLMGYLGVEALSGSMVNLVLEGIPLWIVTSLLYGVGHFSGKRLGYFGISALLGWLLFFLITLSCAGLAFWVLQTGPIRQLLDGIIKIISGSMIPLWFFPEGCLRLIQLLPFQGIYFVPLSILTTNMPSWMIWNEIKLQVVWIVLFYIAARGLFNVGQRKIMVQGG